MHIQSAALAQELATGISDRAFRLYCLLVLRTAGQWTPLSVMAEGCGLTNHEARQPLSELTGAGLAVKQRVYVTGSTGRKTWQTRVRLAEDTSVSVFTADHASEDAA
ncbi:hypothetical protein [Streptomyces sp. NPDC046685]|uniref:hypothetical protein n=1 Tax=Streptomyces sp. NPDC046685 TaxID=3157202 RepID=UPI0033D2EDC1